MCRPFTNGVVIVLAMTLSACAALPMPGGQKVTLTQPNQVADVVPDSRGDVAVVTGPVVPVPALNSGNQALFERAVDLMKQGQLEAAEVLFIELNSDQPELAGPWVNRGLIHVARDEHDQAQSAFLSALDANPQNCDALNQLGVLARKAGRFSDAESYYSQCIDAQPLYPHAHLNLAILYELYMGRLGEALAAYNTYQTMLPEPDARVRGWVMDLERRVEAIAKR
jgi:tetratricopeptide (TPR) repeat protein